MVVDCLSISSVNFLFPHLCAGGRAGRVEAPASGAGGRRIPSGTCLGCIIGFAANRVRASFRETKWTQSRLLDVECRSLPWQADVCLAFQVTVKLAINHLAASGITTDIALKPAILMIRRSGGVAIMRKMSTNRATGKKDRPKTKLGIPDLEHSKAAVLRSLGSRDSMRGYQHAIDEFVA